jgi:hypothetical protein
MRSKIREYVWFAVALMCIFAGTHQTIKLGIGHSYIFFAFAIFALLFFIIRRNMRKNNSANNNSK